MVVERKLLCIEKQMEYHKYVIMSDFFDQEEKKKSKAELDKIMQELEEMKKWSPSSYYCINLTISCFTWSIFFS